ncbi:hypothetical protein [Halobacillus litoralis]|uniref:hypothetical protein n=1 Tax=Halobacillus litoralis TaxID=45668 RepID=UPI001CD6A982|nr:hypothetical protein [Halobacillus litoralis]MCA1021556.1 hypothetical protein [Halobacillus litoralis]
MDKVLLTDVQADKISKCKKMFATPLEALTSFFENPEMHDELSQLTDQEFALALHGWYDVEQDYEVGDWVVVDNGYNRQIAAGRIAGFEDDYCTLEYENRQLIELCKDIRKATEDEIKWAKIGRTVGQYKYRDVVASESNETIWFVTRTADKDFLHVIDFGGSSPTVMKRDDAILVCPVEKRFDLRR